MTSTPSTVSSRSCTRAFGEPHPAVAQSLANLGILLQERDALDEAEAAHRDALRMRMEVFDEDHTAVGESLLSLALVAVARGDLAGAERVLRDRLDRLGRSPEPNEADLDTFTFELGKVLVAQERFQDAEALLLARHTDAKARGDEGQSRYLAQAIVELYDRWGRPDEAARFRTPQG